MFNAAFSTEPLAIIGIGSTLLTLCTLYLSTENIFRQIESLRVETERSAAEYIINSERVWAKMHPLAGGGLRTGRAAKPNDKQREKGAEFQALGGCQKCNRLSCPIGPTGSSGPQGEDGTPGTPGKLGAPGGDGIDIQEEPLPDLPCIICPAGSQGPRGLHGERGLTGPAGPPGVAGRAGQPGRNGMHGELGLAGRRGRDGVPGKMGPVGETVVGGVGVKGPPGLPGAPGLVGSIGLPGRPSNIAGQAGKQGPQGLKGPAGQPGDRGATGHPAAAGEMGQSPHFCPMHCPFKARGQTVFVPEQANQHEFIFPPMLMHSHDDDVEEESVVKDEKIAENEGQQKAD